MGSISSSLVTVSGLFEAGSMVVALESVVADLTIYQV